VCSGKCGFSVPAGAADVHDCKLEARIKSSLGMLTLLFFWESRCVEINVDFFLCKCNLVSIVFWVPVLQSGNS